MQKLVSRFLDKLPSGISSLYNAKCINPPTIPRTVYPIPLLDSQGEVYIDNNLVENAIRPFVLGRKNWLFSGSPTGASASAFWYSLIQTAKANGKDPNSFLLQFLKGLPSAKTKDDMAKLFNDSMGWG